MRAAVHVLYVERAEDQRADDGSRKAGLHLDQQSGLGPRLCPACGGVGDPWRGRCDNWHCALRMCCAEGALFRPEAAQFAVLSPRAALQYDLPAFGRYLSKEGTKRPTEGLVIGAALRAAASELGPDCGVTHTALECADDGEGDAMWAWATRWAAAVRAASDGKVVSVLLDAGAPALTPSLTAGALAAHLGAATPPAALILVLGGPSGVPAAWRERAARAVGRPLKVSLRGGLQHSAPALLELLLLNERGDLVPLLLDRLALPPEQHKAWRRAEREMSHAWLRQLGVRPAAGEADGAPPSARASAADALGAVLSAHRALMQRLAPAPTAGPAPAAATPSAGATQSESSPAPGPRGGAAPSVGAGRRKRQRAQGTSSD